MDNEITKEIRDFIKKADIEQLRSMHRDLMLEISTGLLTEKKYQMELKLIEEKIELLYRIALVEMGYTLKAGD